jgi:hypothetical protein
LFLLAGLNIALAASNVDDVSTLWSRIADQGISVTYILVSVAAVFAILGALSTKQPALAFRLAMGLVYLDLTTRLVPLLVSVVNLPSQPSSAFFSALPGWLLSTPTLLLGGAALVEYVLLIAVSLGRDAARWSRWLPIRASGVASEGA